jgi:hypothetical protein
MLDNLRGHRTFILVATLSLMLAAKTMSVPASEFPNVLQQWSYVFGGLAALLYGSKRGDAEVKAKTKS